MIEKRFPNFRILKSVLEIPIRHSHGFFYNIKTLATRSYARSYTRKRICANYTIPVATHVAISILTIRYR